MFTTTLFPHVTRKVVSPLYPLAACLILVAYANAGGIDPSGWKLPSWSVQSSLDFMNQHGIKTAILSLTAPGTSLLQGVDAATLARQCNEYAASLRESHPGRFGFFAILPPLFENTDLVLEEIRHALDVLHADGVTLYTRYGPGNYYLGHASFRPIWDELDKRGALVFVHPTHSVDTALISSKLPQPVVDYPHETTRTATDLITSNTIRDHPNVKIILSHAGGSFPYLATRAAHLTFDAGLSDKDPEEFLKEARNFYYDLALSSNPYTLDFVTKFAEKDHVLYGSDFPYAPTKTISKHVAMMEKWNGGEERNKSVTRAAAVQILPRLKQDSDATGYQAGARL